MQGLICPAQCKTEPLKALDSRQCVCSTPQCKEKMDGGFGKSRMHRETEISKIEFLAAGETRRV